MTICAALLLHVALAQTPGTSFHPDPTRAERFTYDTGKLKGEFVVTPKWEGITSCTDIRSGKELTRGDNNLGIFHLYRLLSTNKRWADTIWSMTKKVELAADGSLILRWPAETDHPFEIEAVYRWTASDTLDLTIRLKLVEDVPAPHTEVFVGTYLDADVLPRMYLSAGRYAAAKPDFLQIDATPLIMGTYCMFPRDLNAAQMIFDGRWIQGHNPVDWAVSRYMGAPLAMQRDPKANVDVLLMADPASCFAIAMSYKLDPPDGVAGHHSTYFSLFGEDLKKGREVRSCLRAVVGGPFSTEQAIDQFEKFRQTCPRAGATAPRP